jgi:hypothetical protein
LLGQLANEPIAEGESDEEQRARLTKKARKMMFNENGVAYAPWVAKSFNEDVSTTSACIIMCRVVSLRALVYIGIT